MPIIISIEGNIGSGKSTLVKKLKNFTDENYELFKIHYLPEPVHIWESIKDKKGQNILACYYSDQKKYAFAFQMMAYISRLTLLREALTKDYDIIITERSVNTDKMVFAKMLYDSGKIEEIEYKIYNLWFDEFIKDIPKIYIINVKTSPQVAFDRVVERSRSGETIPLDYLKECHLYHMRWLSQYGPDSMLILEGDNKLDDDPNNKVLLNWFSQINIFINRIFNPL